MLIWSERFIDMNEGSNFVSTVIQFAFSLSDARSRRKRIRDNAASTRELAEKIGATATLEPSPCSPRGTL